MTGHDGHGSSESASTTDWGDPAVAEESEDERAARAEDARRFGCGLLTLFIFPPAFIAWVIWDAVTSVLKGLEEATEQEPDRDEAAR